MIEVAIPSEIRVGGFDWVLKSSLADDRHLYANHRRGECVPSRHELTIHTNLDRQDTCACFWHELVHAIDAVYNNQNLDEDTVAIFGNGLFQVFRDLGIYFVKEEAGHVTTSP